MSAIILDITYVHHFKILFQALTPAMVAATSSRKELVLHGVPLQEIMCIHVCKILWCLGVNTEETDYDQ